MPASQATLPAVQAAFVVERYAVYDAFAAGGMASVHFARLQGAHGFRRTVAVKRLLPRLTRDRELALMLVDEARLASRVRHHNVVTMLDVVQTRDELLLVMEYVHGESLAKLLRWTTERQEPVPLAIALAIVIDALHGLHAAHEAVDEQGMPLGLVHRDVSPQNVLVGLDGITRIADFGVARAAGRMQSTRDGTVKGKLSYMAPEQLGGGTVSRVTDVFAAAIVLWEVLTGSRLFAGENDAERVFKVMSAPIPRPSTRRKDLPPALDAIVLRGLERDPARRYASARELAQALEQAAPSVRPSEIAGWVERVVAGRLDERARQLRAIEGELDSVPARPAGEHGSQPTEESEGATGTRPTQLWRGSADVTERTGSRAAIGAGVVALLALLGVMAWLIASPRKAPPASESAAAAPETRPGIVAPEPAPRASPSAAVAPETSPGIAAPGPGVDLPVAAPTPARLEAAPPTPKRRLRPARKAGTSACDPPYSIDTAGRVLFKVECIQ